MQNFIGAKRWYLASTLGLLTAYANGAAINAASCSQSAVQAAIAAASNGDVINVPGGACTWNSFELSKGVHLKGPGAGSATISMSGTLTITKNASASVRLSGFTFKNAGPDRLITVNGAWDAEPPLIHDNVFIVSYGQVMRYQTNGGIIYNNIFRSIRPLENGASNDSGIQHNTGVSPWDAPDTMGTRDSGGKRNLYVEDNTFENMSNQGTDFDDGSRVVFRYNRMIDTSVNSHGLDTSPVGVRHYEFYRNTFIYSSTQVNQNWMIWLRGGTGVIYNNSIANIVGSTWGDKTEIGLSVRMANDGGRLGCATAWPAPHQLGQNHNGSSQFLDPVYFWGNTGAFTWGIREWANTCGNDIKTFLQEGRDFVFSSAPKPGYTAFPYPHPLRSAAEVSVLVTPPMSLTAR